MTTAGFIVIVVGVAILVVAAYVVLRRPLVEEDAPTPEEPTPPDEAPAGEARKVRLEPPVRSVTVEEGEIVVDFAVPLPTEGDDWLRQALTSAALETIRSREADLPVDIGSRRVNAVVARAGRGAPERVGQVEIQDGELPPPLGIDVEVDVVTGAAPLLSHAAEADEGLHPGHGPDQLAPVGRELVLSTEVRRGLLAQGIDPDEDDAPEIGRGILHLAGYATEDVDDRTFLARQGYEEVLVRVVPYGQGDHPELDEEDVSSFLVALGSVSTNNGLLVTGKLVPFHLYDKEHDEIRIVGRQRLQAFVDGLVGR